MSGSGFPSNFEQEMKARLGDAWSAFAAAHNEPAPVSIRLNPRKPYKLADETPVPWATQGRYLKERPSFTYDPAFHGGAYYVQEASSMFLEQAFLQIGGDAGGLTVLDLCAAPGGKSTHLLSLMDDSSMLVTNEVIRSRATILSENIQKWGYPNALVTSSDPEHFASLESLFDIVVVDAPCSGEGMFRKDPDALSSWSPDNVALCARRQQRILDNIWPSVRNGGYLIYATCTYNEQENEEQLLRLINEYGAESVALQADHPQITKVSERGIHAYRFYPHRTIGEGLFMAVLRKSTGPLATHIKASADLPRVAKPVEGIIKSWVNTPAQFFMFKDDIRMVPPGSGRLLNLLTRHLYLVNAGTLIGINKHNKVVPGHAAALSVHLNQNNWPSHEVDRDTAIRYLKKEAIESAHIPRGFALVKFERTPLGWINVLDTRANNLYPAEWRIRSQFNPADER